MGHTLRASFHHAGVVATIFGCLLALSCGGPKPGHYTKPVYDGTMLVENLSNRSVDFEVEDDMQNVRVWGWFTATGGSGNDIIVKVVNPKGADVYNSGKVQSDSFDLTVVSDGSYRVVWDNTFSMLSEKTVTSRVDFEYDIE